MGLRAADNLAWFGFAPILSAEAVSNQDETTLTYFGQNFKGSYHWLVSWIFDQSRGNVELNNEETSRYDYEVVIGENYDPCRNPLYAPRPGLDE